MPRVRQQPHKITERIKDNVLTFYGNILSQYGLDVQEFTATRDELAKLNKVSLRTICRYLDILEDMNLIERHPGRYSTYKVLMNLPDNKK